MKYIRIIITLLIWLILLWLSMRLANRNNIILSDIAPSIPVIGTLYIINNYIRSEYIRRIYLYHNLPVSKAESFLTIFVASSLNFILPLKLGSIYRAHHLKKHHGVSFSLFATTLASFSILSFISASVLLIFVLLAIGMNSGNWHWKLIGILMCMTILVSVLTWMSAGKYPEKTISNRFSYLQSVLKNTANVVRYGNLFWYSGLSVAILTLSNGLSLLLILYCMSTNSNFVSLCVLALTQTLTAFISVTPGAVGFQEAAAALVHDIVSLAPGKILLAVVGIRIIKILTIGIFIYPAHYVLKSRYKII